MQIIKISLFAALMTGFIVASQIKEKRADKKKPKTEKLKTL